MELDILEKEAIAQSECFGNASRVIRPNSTGEDFDRIPTRTVARCVKQVIRKIRDFVSARDDECLFHFVSPRLSGHCDHESNYTDLFGVVQ